MASVAGTYSRAFADVVFQKHLDPARSLQELKALGALISENEELQRVWDNPSVPGDQKRKVLDALVQREGLSRPVRNFVGAR